MPIKAAVRQVRHPGERQPGSVMNFWLLRLHRWVALVFALPLLFVLGTGLVLSIEPWLTVSAIKPGALTAARVEAILAKHDSAGQARAISYRSYDNTLTLGAGRGGGKVIDVATGEPLAGPSALAQTLGSMRGLHERLIFDLGWLVSASSAAMLILALLGVLMGWPRLRNTLSGWHKGVAWILLPLIVLSPLTGLFLAYGVTFTSPPQGGRGQGAPMAVKDAVATIGASRDLSSLVFIRPMGGRMVARLVDDGEYALYAVTPQGLVAQQRNWPRLWHEGNFAGRWSAAMNFLLSVAMLTLLVTGVWIWARRKLCRRAPRARTAQAPAE